MAGTADPMIGQEPASIMDVLAVIVDLLSSLLTRRLKHSYTVTMTLAFFYPGE